MSYKFDIPAQNKSIIKVIGVGGGGSNAVSHMHAQGIKDVEFIICNTDLQALKSSSVPNKLQIGAALTDGLGVGANPEKGRAAAMESSDEIRELLSQDTKMLFITAGMGGGTGTGAAPVIAEIANELGILTVGIVTQPFSFEGKNKTTSASKGVSEMKTYCDTVLVVSNDKLRDVYGNLTIRQAFSKADDVLTTAAKSIAEIITVTSHVNVDFEDVKTVMHSSGPAVMGSATAGGDNRAIRAAEEALLSPLLNNTDIHGAKKILLSITSGEGSELMMDEFTEITDFIRDKAGEASEFIFGEGIDSTLGEQIRVTIIATGFKDVEQDNIKTVFDLESNEKINTYKEGHEPTTTSKSEEEVEENHPSDSDDQSFKRLSFEPYASNGRQKEDEGKKVVYGLDGKQHDLSDDAASDEQADNKPNQWNPDLNEKKRRLEEQAQERIQRLKQLSGDDMTPGDFKEKLEVPAYKRKNVNLENVPHSSENNVSRYNLNDDDEILGNNKFLHDNVD